MARRIQNTVASVHQRLLNKARESSRPFNELLLHFAIERFIYRLSRSPHADSFILKGALMLLTWKAAPSRPTMDIDLLGRISNSFDSIVGAMADACEMTVEEDGMSYDSETIAAVRIAEGIEYEGVRVRVRSYLGNAQVPLQIDVGFGDVVVPGPRKIVYPTILDFPAPQMSGYTMESTIAEKFQAIVKRGILNSRMKDFYDIWSLSSTFDFNGETLAEAIEKTFKQRNTPVATNPTVFSPAFAEDPDKSVQWQGFVRKAKLTGAPEALGDAVNVIKTLIQPILASLVREHTFSRTWVAPGPWR